MEENIGLPIRRAVTRMLGKSRRKRRSGSVCENQPITFGAIVSVNAKYTLKSNSPIDAIPNLIEDINNLTRSRLRATTTVDVLREAIPKTFSERVDGKDVPFLACDEQIRKGAFVSSIVGSKSRGFSDGSGE